LEAKNCGLPILTFLIFFKLMFGHVRLIHTSKNFDLIITEAVLTKRSVCFVDGGE
jgi:hypothetical protein